MKRVAVNLPLKGLAVGAHRGLLAELVAAGLRDVWSDEFNGADGIAALTAFSAWQPSVHITSAISNVFTRSPALLAMSAATLANMAPGRVTFGIGTSSKLVVEQWHGLTYEQPLEKLSSTLTFLRDVLHNGSSTTDHGAVRVSGFKLAMPPEVPPRLAVGALGPRAQRIAAAEADALITGMVSVDDVAKVLANVNGIDRGARPPLELHVGLFLVPSTAPESGLVARRHLCGYLPVPAYAAFQRWLGRGPALDGMLTRWAAGDRRGAVAALPDEIVDALVITGSPSECAARVRAYHQAGADGVNLMLPPGVALDPAEQVAFLAAIVSELEG